MIFAFNYNKYSLDKDGIFLEIKNSLEGKLIYSLELKPNCSSEEEILSLGKWDGLKNGCKCKNDIRAVKCDLDEITCKNIKEIEPKIYKKINSNYICIKTSKNTYRDFMKSNQILSKGSECPKNFKSCGIVDTLENIFCVPKNEKCPITIDNLINTNNERKINNYTQILSIFKLDENINPCIDPAEKTWRSNSVLEEQKKCSTKILGKLYDDRYEKIYIINTTKKELYKDNSIIDYYDKGLILDEIIYLFGRSFIGFKPESIDKYYDNYKDLISKQKIANKSGSILKGFAYFLVFYIIPIISYPANSNNGEDIFACIFIFAAVFSILNFLGGSILITIIYFYSSDINSKLNIKECDEYSNELIQNLVHYYSINTIFSFINIIFFVIIIIFPLIYLVLKYWKKCYEKTKIKKKFFNTTNKRNNIQKSLQDFQNEGNLDKPKSFENINKNDININTTTVENNVVEEIKIANNVIDSNNQLNNNLPNMKEIPVNEGNVKKRYISKSVKVGNQEKSLNNQKK